MTVLEQRFMERMPSLLLDVVEELKKLRKEVEELRTELAEKKAEKD